MVPIGVRCRVSSVEIGGVCGERASVASSAGVTVTLVAALAPFRLAVMVASPSLLAATGKSANKAPAGMFTVGGIEAIAWALDVSATTVESLGARDTVTRRVPGVPLGSVSVAGTSEVTTGGGGVTVTAIPAVGPFAAAGTLALSRATAVTRILA